MTSTTLMLVKSKVRSSPMSSQGMGGVRVMGVMGVVPVKG